MFIVHIIVLVISLLLSVGHLLLLMSALGLGGGTGGAMAAVVLSGIIYKAFYINLAVVLALGFLAFNTNRISHPYLFWLSIASVAIIVISSVLFYLFV